MAGVTGIAPQARKGAAKPPEQKASFEQMNIPVLLLALPDSLASLNDKTLSILASYVLGPAEAGKYLFVSGILRTPESRKAVEQVIRPRLSEASLALLNPSHEGEADGERQTLAKAFQKTMPMLTVGAMFGSPLGSAWVKWKTGALDERFNITAYAALDTLGTKIFNYSQLALAVLLTVFFVYQAGKEDGKLEGKSWAWGKNVNMQLMGTALSTFTSAIFASNAGMATAESTLATLTPLATAIGAYCFLIVGVLMILENNPNFQKDAIDLGSALRGGPDQLARFILDHSGTH